MILVAGVHIHKDQGNITLNTHEQVVKVMGNAASQGADGFHLRGLPELDFKALSFGNVSQGVDTAYRNAVTIQIGGYAYAHIKNVSLLRVSTALNSREAFTCHDRPAGFSRT